MTLVRRPPLGFTAAGENYLVRPLRQLATNLQADTTVTARNESSFAIFHNCLRLKITVAIASTNLLW